ncbi:hypothetical protein [Paraburkholderia sp. RL17-337-BIB-A]|uniref:hypothetical protein n=1 Tax=Paraburkholderia sp. RL17-337-BIB-A TaxID=3031636 RepID=UPI0038BB431C
MSSFLPSLLGAVAGDTASAAHFVTANVTGWVASEFLDRVMKRRRESAQAIVLAELRSGAAPLRESDLEDSAAVLSRYLRAAEEGAARLNLRLLAAVFAGQVRERAIAADDFLYYADMLASLWRHEIILLGTLLRTSAAHPSRPEDDFSVKMAANLAARSQLLPGVFSDGEHFNAVANSLQRTGLPLAAPIGANFAGVGVQYKPTVLLERLNALAEIEGVIERDGEPEHRDSASE